MIATINPATGETIRTFAPLTDSQLDSRIARADAVYRTYRHTSFADRKQWLTKAAEILDAEQDAFGRLMTLEMGKPITAARQEAAKCATACRYYAEHGERLLADEPVDTGGPQSLIRYQPIGPVLAVMPWNFPFWQVFRFLAPTLMAGNVGLLKHASNVPQCALAIEDIVRRAGFPPDVFQALLIGSDQVARVLDDRRVKAATLTGSEPAGRKVAAQAGSQIKKTVLELGGSDPFIVTAHADLAAAARTAAQARCVNSGQSCIAAKRFIVLDAVAQEFETLFVAAMQALIVGDPTDEKTQVGPLATAAILEELEDQVRRSGGRVLTGAKRLPGPGNFYAPTVLADVPPDSPAAREELFGPVATLFHVPDLDAAIALANDTPFGLGAAAFTSDPAEQERLTREIEAGMVFINAMVASDARLPFGGVKTSGYGRELSAWGIREFVNVKTVVIRQLLVLILCLFGAAALRAQGNYEVQVYASELVPKGITMVEMHSNFTAKGSPGGMGMFATHHAEHQTLEITHGFNEWFEVGFYQFTSIQPEGSYEWVGTHIRPRFSVPERYHLPVGLSLSQEIGYQRPGFDPNTWTWELRPIIDKQLGKFYMGFNPVFEKSFHGPNKDTGWEFSPNIKFAYDVHKRIAAGVEYYGAYGKWNDWDPVRETEQMILPAVDIDFGKRWEFNFGVGVGVTQATDHLLIKCILGYRLGKMKD